MTNKKKYSTISISEEALKRLIRYKAIHAIDKSLKTIIEDYINKLEITSDVHDESG